jgi:hypothetical protein
MTFYQVSDDPAIQVTTFNPDQASGGYLTIPQTEELTFSDSEANELLEALNINPNSSENSGIPEFNPDGINGNSGIPEFIPDRINGNSGIPEFIPDGINGNSGIPEFIPDGINGNSGIPEFIPDGINGNSGLLEFDGLIDLGMDLNIPSIVSQNGFVQRDGGVKVNSDKKEESGKSDTESEKSNLEEL